MVRLLDTFTAARILRLMRTMLTLWVVCLCFIATSSHATTECFGRTYSPATPYKDMQPNVRFSVGNITSSKVLDTFYGTISLSQCTGFANTPVTWNWRVDNIGASSVDSFTNSTVDLTFITSCTQPNKCFDANNAQVITGNANSDGIVFKNRLTINGFKSDGTNCHTINNVSVTNQGTSFLLISVSATADQCSSFEFRGDFTAIQNAGFSPSNVTKISFGFNCCGSIFFASKQPNFLPNGAVYPFFNPGGNNYITSTGTCALSLSSSNINIGNLVTNLIRSTPSNTVVVSKPLTMTITNCAGFASGKNKTLQWFFLNGNTTDRTRMENAITVGGATGLSAQIVATDHDRIDHFLFFATGRNFPLGPTVSSGENYLTSFKTSDNQTLNYQVNLIRNTDAVKAGAFSSTATVTLSYQ